MSVGYRCEALGPQHDRRSFSCGVPELDRYFREHVTQDIRRRVTSCFVALAGESNAIAGYYTLGSAAIPIEELPADLTRRLPRYPTLPAVRIGRLAVATDFRRHGVGEMLLMDAAMRADHADQANYALLVDAKDDTAAAFYRRYAFIEFASNSHTLFLPVATALKALSIGAGSRD